MLTFNLRKGPLSLRFTTGDTYSSLSFFSLRTDNFAVVKGSTAEVVLVGPNQQYTGKDAVVIKSPGMFGVVLQRVLIPDKSFLGQGLALQAAATCSRVSKRCYRWRRFPRISHLFQAALVATTAFPMLITLFGSMVMPGVALGVSSVVCGLLTLKKSVKFLLQQNGQWEYNPMTGSPSSGLYTRLATAFFGLLALSKSEAIYMTTFTDSKGRPLSSEHDYILRYKETSRDIGSGWSSCTVYGMDSYLVPNKAGKYSVQLRDVSQEILLSSRPPEDESEEWLPIGSQSTRANFNLTLRFYEPHVPAAQLVTPVVDRVE